MCGGQVEVWTWTPRSDKNSVNSLDRNSPALSLCRVPTMRVGRGEFLLAKAVNVAMNLRTCEGASDLFFMK
eukprot:1692599-Pleurochrysis_carterae.AAC.1